MKMIKNRRWKNGVCPIEPLEVRAHHLLCAVCTVGGCKTPPPGKRVIDRIRKKIKAHPMTPLRLLADIDSQRTHFDDLYCGSKLLKLGAAYERRRRDHVGRYRDLWVMRQLGLRPNTVHPALDVVKRLFHRVKSLEGLCFRRGKPDPKWPDCPHARKGYFHKVRGNGNYDIRLCEKLEGKGPYALLPIRSHAELVRVKEESCKRIAETDHLYIRAHHLICIICSWIAGHLDTPLFEDNLYEALVKMRDCPEVSVTVVEGCCMICDPCPSYWPDGNQCLHSEVKDTLKDLFTLRKLGLEPGDTLPAKELYKRLYKRIKSAKEICGWGGDMVSTCSLWSVCGSCRQGYYEEARKRGGFIK